MQVTAAKINEAWQQLLIVESADSLLEVALQEGQARVSEAGGGCLQNGSITTDTYRLPLEIAGVLYPSRKGGTAGEEASSPQ